MKLGRNRPLIASPHPMLARYAIGSSLPTPPPSCDYQSLALPALQNIYGNDTLGNCTIADSAKSIAIWTRGRVIPTLDQVIAMYSACGGYIPGNAATDQGCDELVVMNWLKVNGLAGVNIIGSVTLDANNPLEIMTAIWLFGRVRIAIELPLWWTPQTAPGFTWHAAGVEQTGPDPKRGHDFGASGYDQEGLYIDTWGLASESSPSRLGWDALKYATPAFGGAAYASICSEWALQSGSGYDLTALLADAAAIGVVS